MTSHELGIGQEIISAMATALFSLLFSAEKHLFEILFLKQQEFSIVSVFICEEMKQNPSLNKNK